jgi:hypothetical protein
VDLFGAQVQDLPDIWERLVDAGFESGHAYGKALRTVKSCVGATWCRYGVQDSVGFAIRIENRYMGWKAVVDDPEKRRRFRQFVNTDVTEPVIEMVVERGQPRPGDWPAETVSLEQIRMLDGRTREERGALEAASWVPAGQVSDFPQDGGNRHARLFDVRRRRLDIVLGGSGRSSEFAPRLADSNRFNALERLGADIRGRMIGMCS